MSNAPDKYDEAIAFLTAHPHEIMNAWRDGGRHGHSAGCLFAYARRDDGDGCDQNCGCLTMIRAQSCTSKVIAMDADHAELLRLEIAGDHRIPESAGEITLAHLPVFAEWQRRLDRELTEVVTP